MLSINYMNDKFIPTPLPDICAPREGLLSMYNKLSQNRLTVVSAPAGYGKTVSTLLWIKASGRKPIWFGLDEYDNAPFVFYKMFCTGIMSVQPDNIRMEEILNSPNFYSSPIEHTLNLLLEFRQDNDTYALILDDFHTISNKKILKSLPFILKRLPFSFDILILTRTSLPMELSDFTKGRNYVEISAGDLAFSTKEIQKYYNSLGQRITAKQAQSIYDATGGWAMGINVLSKSDTPEAPIGNKQLLEQYITKNLWKKWDSNLREFMTLTSVADEMDSELCHLLTGEENTDEILDKLLVQNLFAAKTSLHTYRYHHLFHEFLKAKLKERSDINVPALLLKIAGIYYDRGEYFRALDYYVRAENHEGIMKCIPQLNSLYLDFDVEEWVNYFSVFVYDRLSQDFIQQNIFLVMEYAWLNHLKGNTELMLQYIDIMNEYLIQEENWTNLLEYNILGYACIINFTDFRNTLYEYSKQFASWTGTLPQLDFNDILMATPTITQNFPYMHRSVFDCLCMIPDIEHRLLEVTDIFGMFFVHEADLFRYCVSAGLYYEQNRLDLAMEAVMLAQNRMNRDTRFEIQFCIFMILSTIQNARNNPKEVGTISEYCSKRITEENAQYLNPNFIAIDTKLKLWDGDTVAAKQWFEQLFVTEDEQLRFYKLYQYFTSARAYLVLSDFKKARYYLERLKKLSTEYHRPLDVAEAGVLLSVVEWNSGAQDKAVQLLEEVLQNMQAYEIIRVIADEGAAVLPILKRIISRAEQAVSPVALDLRYLNQIYLTAYAVSLQHPGLTAQLHKKAVKLSKQQLYILTLLSQGYRNSDIVMMTGLTINTIKAHTKLIYSKLNVNKVEDALNEARRLGIL